MSVSSQRLEWVDVAKAIAIISVVIGHIHYDYPNITLLPISAMIAWLWHVPVFFMIGGFFLKDEKLVKPWFFIRGKVKSLYLLILYIYIPVTLLHNVLIDIGFYDVTVSYSGKYVSYWGGVDFFKGLVETVCFAGREPIVGAMWFVYVLFLSLCLLSIVSYIVHKLSFISDSESKEKVRCLILLIGVVCSNVLTNVYGFTIPRCNNVFTASWLIYLGMLIVRRYHFKFDSLFLFIISIVVFYCYAVLQGGVYLNRNEFHDVCSLSLASMAALYIVIFVSKKIKGKAKVCLAYIGRDSFYIMGLHFIAFKLCTLTIFWRDARSSLAFLNPECCNILEYIFFAIGGVSIPLLFMFCFRKVKSCLKRMKV